MPAKIVVPELGESVLEATVGRWHKRPGDRVKAGEVLVSLETDKVDLEVGAERDGILARIERQEGEDVKIGDVLGIIEEATGGAGTEPEAAGKAAADVAPAQAPAVAEPARRTVESLPPPESSTPPVGATPSARRLARERGVDWAQITPANKAGRVTKEDVERSAGAGREGRATEPAAAAPPPALFAGDRSAREERVRMSRRRLTIAQRLVEAQHTAAMLTTFNEIDMGAVMELRRRQKAWFEQRHGVSLGITSFFVKASIAALREFPKLNAEIDGEEIVYKHYYDIGVAVGASEGLVVPVLRQADRLSFAEIERAVKNFARQAEDHTLSLEDLRGGTFTITNGGVFGSLMSTPILNPPQVAILGLHKVQDRPVSREGAIVTRPMMYVALSYDHRLVDGREAVQFLVRIKQLIEDPGSLLLEG